ncbi:MAG: hypothetical protein IPJ16_02320 [Bacteroidales bacterium]|nr:hypothetical protein [Bacteroidales bacterium]
MRNISIIGFIILVLSVSCESNDGPVDIIQSINIDSLVLKNASKVSIKNGIAGTLLKKAGDCMPMISGSNTCRTYPVSRTILIYNSTNMNQVEGWGPSYNSVNSKLIAKCNADQVGFFQVTIDPGKYSIFIKENDKFYANSTDGQGVINPVTVKTDSASTMVLILDYAVY